MSKVIVNNQDAFVVGGIFDHDVITVSTGIPKGVGDIVVVDKVEDIKALRDFLNLILGDNA